jgi:cytochrome P450
MHYMLNFVGPKATETEMASHINALMMAGVITTSTFLSGVLYYLMTNPESFNKLKIELRTTFASIDEITCTSTAQCGYLAAVIQEGLRIYPPAGGAHLPRVVPPEGAMIAGCWIPGRVSLSSIPHLCIDKRRSI